MKRIIIFIFCTIFISVLNGQEVYTASKSSIKFTSDAPLELIEAESSQLQGALKTSDRSFVFRAPMNTFEGFNSDLQRTHFNTNYLETSKFPYTQFEGKIIEEIDFNKPGTYEVRGKGKFTCHGVEQERLIKCKLVISQSGIKISSNYTVMLDDHNIKIPSVVNQKIAEEIIVILSVEMKKKQ
jgi:hypothetical protein